MSDSSTKDMVIRFVDCLNTSSHDELLSIMSDDLAFTVPDSIPNGGTVNKEQFKVLLNQVMDAFEIPPKYSITSMTAEENRVAAEVRGVGIARNGKMYDNKYFIFFVIESGVIKIVNEYLDTDHIRKTLFE